MKKTLIAILVTVFLLVPALCFSAYVIHLKDGREFTTDQLLGRRGSDQV